MQNQENHKSSGIPMRWFRVAVLAAAMTGAGSYLFFSNFFQNYYEDCRQRIIGHAADQSSIEVYGFYWIKASLEDEGEQTTNRFIVAQKVRRAGGNWLTDSKNRFFEIKQGGLKPGWVYKTEQTGTNVIFRPIDSVRPPLAPAPPAKKPGSGGSII